MSESVPCGDCGGDAGQIATGSVEVHTEFMGTITFHCCECEWTGVFMEQLALIQVNGEAVDYSHDGEVEEPVDPGAEPDCLTCGKTLSYRGYRRNINAPSDPQADALVYECSEMGHDERLFVSPNGH